MSVFTHFWQSLVQRFRPRAPWSAGEFERELSAARQERQNLLGQLSELQAEVERGLSAAKQEQQGLLGQLHDLHARVEQELSDAGLEKQALRGELTGLQSGLEHGLAAVREEQHGLLGQMGGLQSELEHGLAAVREEQHGLLGQVSGLQSEIQHGLAAVREEQHGLLGQLNGLQSELEHGLAALRQEQHGLLGQLTSLQADFDREMTAARQEQQALLGQVSRLQDDLEHTRSRDEQLRAELQQRFEQVRIERDLANQEITVLRTSLADANARQETTDARVNTLEIRLKEQRQAHEAALQDALVRERRQGRRLNAALTVAAAAFVLGIVGSAINFWEVKNTTRLLVEVSQGIRALQTSMQGHSSAAGEPAAPAPAAPEAGASPGAPQPRPDDAGGASREPEDAGPGLTGQQLPEPDFVVSKSLPLDQHTFKSRQDARAFFEENARQPGVVTLPSGLQYRELIPGSGKIPGAGDQVVVEYRAFRPDGTETDNSFKEDLPTTFTVNEAIPALKEALQHMQEGAQWELYIPASLAYPGTRKRGPYGFEPLILTVELVSVVAGQPASQP